jgi:alkanesulfonate monooxygenase SsuD/methylene tetrahydromethanopterin reductase-like flavin-dependent oxidoreductase (luciferase family)
MGHADTFEGDTVEFGLFVQGFLPGPAAHDSEAEHQTLLNEAQYVQCADRNNFKFAWVSEHHALPEYSHISANEVFMGYCAATTERIHLGSGIFNVSPRVNHPVRTAEKVAMLDHLTNRRFEFGTGRGAGSHEVGTFNIHDPSSTKADFDDTIREFVRMWERKDYTYQGTRWSMDVPHNILPKPYAPGHPPIWVACGNAPTFDKAGEMGIGVLAFTYDVPEKMTERAERYKQAVADCKDPVGQFKNDNIMMTGVVYCAESREKAREQAMAYGARYVITLVSLYHDSFFMDFSKRWPHPPERLNEEQLDQAIELGFLLCGSPEEVCEQLEKRNRTRGYLDQLVFTSALEISVEERLAMIELVGQHVIPEFDKDPVISTDRARAEAKPKFGEYAKEPPLLDTIWTKRVD